MRLAIIFILFSAFCLCAEEKISQAKFFRNLGIKPTEEEAAPYGGLRTLVITHKALVEDRKKLELVEKGIRDLRAFESLEKLEWLRLSHNPMSDLTPLGAKKPSGFESLWNA